MKNPTTEQRIDRFHVTERAGMTLAESAARGAISTSTLTILRA